MIQEIAAPDIELARLAVALGADRCGGPLSVAEQRLVRLGRQAPPLLPSDVTETIEAIRSGQDPLGDAYLRARTASNRRLSGAFYTPLPLVDVMTRSVLQDRPARIVDAGCGSGRFIAASFKEAPSSTDLVAVDSDPMATLTTRAVLATIGAQRARVVNADYSAIELESIPGRTAFLSNPPYVRHHSLSHETKDWAHQAGRSLGVKMSALSGLHVHFFLKTALLAAPGDVGCFITSSEWLDVGYGSALRDLFVTQLGVKSIDMVSPRANPFGKVMTTATIVYFEVGGRQQAVALKQVDDHRDILSLGTGRLVDTVTLKTAGRWGQFLRGDRPRPPGLGVLGDIVQVHRGLVTGANKYFVMSKSEAKLLGLEAWAHPAISSAEEILSCGGVIRDSPALQVVIALPANAETVDDPNVIAFLRSGEHANGVPAASQGYISRHRRPWWNLGNLPKPPVVATYMARRPPTFALNPDGLVILNIAHGLYPNNGATEADLSLLVGELNRTSKDFSGLGRTYHGGLEKFEPKEMEALPLGGLVCRGG